MRLRVDDAVAAAMLLVFVSVAPSPVYVDGSATTEQAKDGNGAPLWRVRLLDATDESRDPQRLTVTIAASVAPAVPRLAQVRLRGLSVSLWGEAPLRASLRADAVEVVGSDAAPASAASAFLSDIEGGEER